ncbi:CREB/ATF bZIP transcription factor [Leptodactylus fuscus]|uniref:CREB/ATF bZIP transcription factor n=1 Tax=Leptodactylus fuscus TaxID=238119 RepID=UPI003F4E9660
MRHRLRERPKAAACTARSKRRERRGRTAASKETSPPRDWSAPSDGALLCELDELLPVTPWWKEDERPEDPALTELLQQLAETDDCISAPHSPLSEPRPSCLQDTPFVAVADSHPEALHQAAARGRGAGNKNAVAARLNRLRKKEYVSGLECQVARLSDENARLQRERRALGVRVRELESEARYLRAVLANDSALSQLLSRLTGLGGVKLSTSLFRDPCEKPDDHDYALPGLVSTVDQEEEESAGAAPSGGVCLHVDKEKVSVEFCQACARSAASSAKIFSFR